MGLHATVCTALQGRRPSGPPRTLRSPQHPSCLSSPPDPPAA
jgi:hypothetical protein